MEALSWRIQTTKHRILSKETIEYWAREVKLLETKLAEAKQNLSERSHKDTDVDNLLNQAYEQGIEDRGNR
jgi:hypothetical protein